MAFEHLNPLQAARSELKSLLSQKADIERKIEAVQQTIRILEPVYSDLDPVSFPLSEMLDIGLTDRVRVALRSEADLSPTEIRDLVVSGGFDFGDRPNPMAAIHTAIKRLVSKGEAKEVSTSEGKKYRATLDYKKLRRYGETIDGSVNLDSSISLSTFAGKRTTMPPPTPPDFATGVKKKK